MWTFLEYILHDRQCRKGIRPTGVEGQLRDSLRGLRLCQTAVHRAVEVVRNLRDLAVSNKCADRDETSIARCRSGRSHKSRNRTSVVYCTTPGATLPNCCSTAAARFASPSLSSGRGTGEAGGR